jgi:hypothetical protein
MAFSRQTLTSVAQVLTALTGDSAALLIYKHLGLRKDDYPYGALGYLQALETADNDTVMQLVGELARESSAIRADAPTKYVFDGRWREFERWLLHDGWLIEDGRLVRVTPGAEEATGVRDALLEELEASDLDGDGEVRRCVEESADAFVREPPDFNDSTTKVRIALESTARRAAAQRAAAGGAPYPTDTWGNALAYLRNAGVLELEEEQTLARVYTFISPGAHIPAGVTDEEWARLSRTFALSSCYFLLKKHEAAP